MRPIPSKTIRQAAVDALHALDQFCPQIREKAGSVGGYLYAAFADTPDIPVLMMYIGDERERHEKYAYFAREKCLRVAANDGHQLSFESRNEEEEKYQGSIKLRHPHVEKWMVIGFSGMPAEADEALCLLVAVMSKCMPLTMAQELADISSNETFRSVAKHPIPVSVQGIF